MEINREPTFKGTKTKYRTNKVHADYLAKIGPATCFYCCRHCFHWSNYCSNVFAVDSFDPFPILDGLQLNSIYSL